MSAEETTLHDIEAACGILLEKLREHGNTLAVAESCTGGLIAAAMVSHSGCSDNFCGGAVVYSNALKHSILGVPEDIFTSHGAVSGECVSAMLSGTHKYLNSDCAIAVSGIAGPGGAMPGKPVGTVFLGAAVKDSQKIVRMEFPGGRNSVRMQAAAMAVSLAIKLIEDYYHE